MKVVILGKKEFVGSNSEKSVRISMGLQSYAPIYEENKMVTMEQVAVVNGDSASTLTIKEGDEKRPVYRQKMSVFSTIVSPEIANLLKEGDHCNFELSSFNTRNVESKGAYMNAQGEFTFSATQVARMLGNLKGNGASSTTSGTTKKRTISLAPQKGEEGNTVIVKEDEEGLPEF